MAIHYAALRAKAQIPATMMVIFIAVITVTPAFIYLLTHQSSIYNLLAFPDADLCAQVNASAIFLLLFLLALFVLFSNTEKLTIISSVIFFGTFLAISMPSEHHSILTTTPDLGLARFAKVVAIAVAANLLVLVGHVLILSIATSYALELVRLYVSWKQPDATIFYLLCGIAAEYNDNWRNWNDLASKRRTILSLERAASLVDGVLVTRLTSRASSSRIVATSQFKFVASALRGKVVWVLTPTEYTRQEFITKLQEFLTSFALGQWDELVKLGLERADAPAPSIVSWTRRVLKICQFAVVAVGPFVLLHLYQEVGEPLNQAVRDYAILFSLLWFVVCVASEVDPLWKERLGGFKDLLSVIKPSGGKK